MVVRNVDPVKARNNVLLGVVLSFVSLFAIVESLRMPTYSHLEGWYSAPGLVPLFLGVSLLLMAISVLVTGVRQGGWQQLGRRTENLADHLRRPEFRRVLLSLVLIALYIFILLGRMPYVVSTSLFLFVYMFAIRDGGVWQKIVLPLIIAVVSAWVIDLTFTRIFLIPLP